MIGIELVCLFERSHSIDRVPTLGLHHAQAVPGRGAGGIDVDGLAVEIDCSQQVSLRGLVGGFL